jgi:peptidylprolyl isomerase/peptidyl-prolyl cis-trans isomerase D
MGLMNKLRDSMPWVLAGMAGIFLLTIIFDWGAQGTMFQGSAHRDPNTAGIVDGQKITFAEYQQAVDMLTQQQMQQGQKAVLSEAEQEQVRNQAWDQVVGRALIKKQIAEMGIHVTDAEVREMMFYNPPSDIRQQFTDSTGTFRQQEYWKALRDPKNDTIVRTFEQNFRDQMVMNKWQNLMSASMRVTNSEIKTRYSVENDKATVQVVRIAPTAPASDFLAKVTDDQAAKFYEEHKNRYKSEEQRKVKFVIFSTAPTGRDSAVAMEGLENMRRRFAAAPLENIDTFASELADELGVKASPVQALSPQSWKDPNIMNAKVGDAIITQGPTGPQITKIVGIKDTGAALFHSRHILIGFGKPENRDSAAALANKIYDELKAGGNFAELALKYSQDGSARQGGDLGWTGPGQFVHEFEVVANKAPLNQVQPPTASQFGYHIIEVLERTRKMIQGISIPYEVKSSGKTAQMATQQANIFRNRAEKEGFDEAAKALGKEVITDVPPLEKNGQALFGLQSFNDWVFKADKGDIREPLKVTQGQMVVVGQVYDILPKGFKKLDEVKESIKSEIAKKLRVESIKARAEQIRNSLQPGQSLDALAASTGDSSLKPVTMTIGPAEAAQSMGVEYVINHAAYDQLKPGEVSKALKGENAYYIVQLVDLKRADPAGIAAATTTLRNQLTNERQQRFISKYIENLKKKADIQDFRGN